MKKEAGSDYLEIAKNLAPEESERVLSRMSGKLPRRFDKDKLSKIEAIAIQLEIEDEQLEEWREKMEKIRNKNID
jgi:hypothetical protein